MEAAEEFLVVRLSARISISCAFSLVAIISGVAGGILTLFIVSIGKVQCQRLCRLVIAIGPLRLYRRRHLMIENFNKHMEKV